MADGQSLIESVSKNYTRIEFDITCIPEVCSSVRWFSEFMYDIDDKLLGIFSNLTLFEMRKKKEEKKHE